MPPNNPFLTEAAARGFIAQCTDLDALGARMQAGPIAAYIGFDATADSLHVGHLMPIMLLRLLQKHGHRPVPLLGGGTTRIGDPSGKDTGRQMLDASTIAANIAAIQIQLANFFAHGTSATDAIFANNADWLDRLGYIDLLREVGPHFSVNRMLTFDSVRLRLEREQPLSFLEFNYMILQSYDFRALHRLHGVVLQLGGTDQWGNIVCGIELARRTDAAQLYGLTTPLLTTASGAKMGKTAQGAVWLAAHRLSPYDYWQFWRNVEDADTARFLRLFTDLPLEEIAEVDHLHGAALNEAKKRLATEATTLAHGAAAAAQAAETARLTFEAGATADTLPTFLLDPADHAGPILLTSLLVITGLCASKTDARKLIHNGGARLDDVPIHDEHYQIDPAALGAGVKISAGRKQHRLVRLLVELRGIEPLTSSLRTRRSTN